MCNWAGEEDWRNNRHRQRTKDDKDQFITDFMNEVKLSRGHNVKTGRSTREEDYRPWS